MRPDEDARRKKDLADFVNVNRTDTSSPSFGVSSLFFSLPRVDVWACIIILLPQPANTLVHCTCRPLKNARPPRFISMLTYVALRVNFRRHVRFSNITSCVPTLYTFCVSRHLTLYRQTVDAAAGCSQMVTTSTERGQSSGNFGSHWEA